MKKFLITLPKKKEETSGANLPSSSIPLESQQSTSKESKMKDATLAAKLPSPSIQLQPQPSTSRERSVSPESVEEETEEEKIKVVKNDGRKPTNISTVRLGKRQRISRIGYNLALRVNIILNVQYVIEIILGVLLQ
jgi:hypothetical protein